MSYINMIRVQGNQVFRVLAMTQPTKRSVAGWGVVSFTYPSQTDPSSPVSLFSDSRDVDNQNETSLHIDVTLYIIHFSVTIFILLRNGIDELL